MHRTRVESLNTSSNALVRSRSSSDSIMMCALGPKIMETFDLDVVRWFSLIIRLWILSK